MDLVRQEGLPAVVVNPSAPVGPRDIKPTPTGKMIRDAAAGPGLKGGSVRLLHGFLGLRTIVMLGLYLAGFVAAMTTSRSELPGMELWV